MATRSATQTKDDRLSIRADAEQKELLTRAASASHMNTSQFVLQTSLRAAREILSEESQLILTADEYAWLMELLDAPAAEAPRLRTALETPPVWNK